MTTLGRIAAAAIIAVVAVSGLMMRAPADHSGAPKALLPPLAVQAAANGAQARLSAQEFPADWTALNATITGRHSQDSRDAAGAIGYHWPAFTAKARFSGDEIALRLEDRQNRLRVLVDDGATLRAELTKPGRALLHLSGLGSGAHDISLQMISEAAAQSAFMGFRLPPTGQPLPAPAASPRQIWFIGDSDTVGYGNSATSRNCSGDQVFATTDTSQSFPALLGQHFGADVTITARSGVGLLRNYDGADAGRAMKQLYPLVLPDQPQAREAALPPPDVIVLAIGSNDFTPALHKGEAWPDTAALERDFATALGDFITALHRDHPESALISIIFPEAGPEVGRSYQAIAPQLADLQGFATALIELPDLERTGCHWHPSAADHRLIAALIAPMIEEFRPAWKSRMQDPDARVDKMIPPAL